MLPEHTQQRNISTRNIEQLLLEDCLQADEVVRARTGANLDEGNNRTPNKPGVK
jgi:hypothetical protein